MTADTVEQIEPLFTQAVNGVRSSIEHARTESLIGRLTVVSTAGELWKAYAKGKEPCFQASAIEVQPQTVVPDITCPNAKDEAQRNALDRAHALVIAEGGDKAAAMEKLIARVQLQADLDNASVLRMPLAEFVAAATRVDSASDDRRGAPRAGEAWQYMVKSAPQLQAQWELARAKLEAVRKVLQDLVGTPEYKAAKESEKRNVQAFVAAIREALDEARNELHARHLPSPENLEDRVHLARIVEMPDEAIHTGNLTAREIFEYALAWADRQTIKAKLAADIKNELDQGESLEAARKTKTPTKAKRSTVKGEGQVKLIAALTKHHQYSDGGCLNLDPIGNNQLARLARVSPSTAKTFFDKHFSGHLKYRTVCANAGFLVAALKILNQEYSPIRLFGANPPSENGREDEE